MESQNGKIEGKATAKAKGVKMAAGGVRWQPFFFLCCNCSEWDGVTMPRFSNRNRQSI
jgi:hypothetical protein